MVTSVRVALAHCLLIGAQSGQTQSAYRCRGPYSSTIFQQVPCMGGGPVDVRSGNVIKGDPAAVANARREREAREHIE